MTTRGIDLRSHETQPLSEPLVRHADLIYTMTGKGPGFVTDVPGIFMFETTFQGTHYAQGSAISIVMLIMVTVVIVPYLWYSFRKEVEL